MVGKTAEEHGKNRGMEGACASVEEKEDTCSFIKTRRTLVDKSQLKNRQNRTTAAFSVMACSEIGTRSGLSSGSFVRDKAWQGGDVPVRRSGAANGLLPLRGVER